ncbi:GCN5-related N-acetyltransferase [Vulcanisaeta moutnovskia 768-28]|uniref:GCN5-related N-acetyltransferase n=1 Tax=Vulcanisaeta moutnovskia (strain 768-28) TaxID=985053 RepID=F0QTB7_VULM7|nr:GNAT family N-acetyltransferase [Vulcanisaeta moutnovskia]ADY00459.1 GCN5-related N-acetyltransferase [Vulcanisaeta moutnovskia 768-28]
MNELTIRKASSSDAEQVIGFTRNTFQWGDYIPSVINEWINEGTAYVAIIKDRIVGVVNMVLIRETSTAWLEGIRIHPSYRRMGIGKALTEYVLNEAVKNGIRYAMLMIADWNEPSRCLAKSLGFHEVLTLFTGVARPSQVSIVRGEAIREVIREALKRTNGYFCTTRRHWLCTRAIEDFVMTMIDEVYVGRGIGLGEFSIGPPTTPIKTEVLATEGGDFENYYGKFIVYEKELGQAQAKA